MDFEKEIKKKLSKHIKNIPNLEIPPRQELGDYALPCFTLSKELKKTPIEIAKELSNKIKPDNAILRAVAVGPYVNFFINKSILTENTLQQILKEKEEYGTKKPNRKRVVVEFSSPNIAKPFGVGHLRSTVIGNALSNLYETQGYKSVRLNYLGDWGTQFGKLIVAYKKWGNTRELKKDPINHLLKLYIKFHKEENEKLEAEARLWFNKLERGDKESLMLWKKFKNLSLKEFKRIYSLLNVNFDSYAGESSYNNKLKNIVKTLEKKGLIEEDQGAKVVKFKDLTPALIQKSDGSSLYITRDIAAFQQRAKNYKPEKIIYVVGSEQTLHFRQLFYIMAKLGVKTEAAHVSFGLFFLPEGKMSTRKGRVIFLEDLITKVITLAEKTINEKNPRLKEKKRKAKDIGIGAIIFWDLVHDRAKDIIFDTKRVLDFEGETGPYIQYTHARACSILKKARQTGKADYSKLVMPAEQKLIILLSEYNTILKDSTRQHKPSILARYLISTSQTFNEFYHTCNCLKEKNRGLRNARLKLTKASAQVLKNGLKLLGLKALREM